ncbi:MAG: DUF4158 domain-containing protein [Herminiimonas sp.]|nr:DUF4158 domain-containing protein [Herminiimonas sp.]
MQSSDTAYPRFKSRLSPVELERFYTLTDAERIFCEAATRSDTTRLGFALLLKTYQRLGNFVTSFQVRGSIVEHTAAVIGASCEQDYLRSFDASQARRTHLSVIRQFLSVKAFSEPGKLLLQQALADAALTKDDVIDIVNIGIETLVRHSYELPAFDTLVREARAQRTATTQAMYARIEAALGESGRAFLDALYVVGDNPRHVSTWNDIKQDAALPTIDGMRDLVWHVATN